MKKPPPTPQQRLEEAVSEVVALRGQRDHWRARSETLENALVEARTWMSTICKATGHPFPRLMPVGKKRVP